MKLSRWAEQVMVSWLVVSTQGLRQTGVQLTLSWTAAAVVSASSCSLV